MEGELGSTSLLLVGRSYHFCPCYYSDIAQWCNALLNHIGPSLFCQKLSTSLPSCSYPASCSIWFFRYIATCHSLLCKRLSSNDRYHTHSSLCYQMMRRCHVHNSAGSYLASCWAYSNGLPLCCECCGFWSGTTLAKNIQLDKRPND